MIDKLDLLGILDAEGELGDRIVPEPSGRRKLLNYVIGCLVRIIFCKLLARFGQYNTLDKILPIKSSHFSLKIKDFLTLYLC